MSSTCALPICVMAVLKKLHPATIHFPIALFLMAAATELFVMRRKGAGLESAVRVLVYGGAIGAVLAILFGWIHTRLWFGGDTVIQVYRWHRMIRAEIGRESVWDKGEPVVWTLVGRGSCTKTKKQRLIQNHQY